MSESLQWTTAIGSIVFAATAIWTLVLLVADRRREFAKRVFVRGEQFDLTGTAAPAKGQQWQWSGPCRVLNGSDGPIYDATVAVLNSDWMRRRKVAVRRTWAVIDPHSTSELSDELNGHVESKKPGGIRVPLEIEFTDGSGRRWRRDPDGRLYRRNPVGRIRSFLERKGKLLLRRLPWVER
jgi:hypothetical protein